MAKQRLQESFQINKENIKKLSLKESEQIIEKDGEQYNCRGAYEIPVWRLDEKNLNERNYTSSIAEKLMSESKTTLGLANHPEGEADVKDTFAVEKNPHVREGIMYVDAYFVGANGELANEIIEAGGEIGLSSSAFGEVQKDGTVLTEGFAIERYADWVESPSYQVYAGKDTKIITNESVEEITAGKIKEEDVITATMIDATAVNEDELSEENSTNIEEEDKKVNHEKEKKERVMPETKDTKLSIEEKNLKLGVKHLFQEAEAVEDLKEKRGKYEEILNYCEGVSFASDYIEKANEEIGKINQMFYELADKGKEVDSLKESSEKEKQGLEEQLKEKQEEIQAIEEKFDKAVEMLDDLKLREQKINEMYKIVVAEKNGMVTASDYNELNKYCEKVEKELKEAKKENRDLKKALTEKKREKPVTVKEDEKVVEKEPIQEATTTEEDLEQYNNSPNFEEILEWYEEKVKVFPKIKEFKEEILTKRTIMEAQRAFLRFKDLIEDAPSPYKTKYYGGLAKTESKAKRSHTSSMKIREGWN